MPITAVHTCDFKFNVAHLNVVHDSIFVFIFNWTAEKD